MEYAPGETGTKIVKSVMWTSSLPDLHPLKQVQCVLLPFAAPNNLSALDSRNAQLQRDSSKNTETRQQMKSRTDSVYVFQICTTPASSAKTSCSWARSHATDVKR